eukprot:gb/GECH01004750.1/.p1 GENE.gb/GECH01004750.1/~~gb/GECH01004750.1/.p1  ORF type:complete len:493 (+),score=101.40 gb/GECH01004750.1/:1-1479(+)
MHINNNPDILNEIFSFLDPIRDVFPIATCVCKTWNQTILKKPNTLFKHLYLFENKTKAIKGVPTGLTEQYNLNKQALNGLINAINKTQVHLETFFIDHYQIGIDLAAFSSTLFERMIRSNMFQYIQVLSLPLTENHNYDDQLLAKALTQASNSITHFVVPLDLGKEATQALVDTCGPKLKSIFFTPSSSLDKETIITHARLESLEEIYIGDDLDFETRLALIKAAPNLKRYHFPYGHFHGIDTADLAAIADNCHQIEELGIGQRDIHELEIFTMIAEKLPHIKYLCVGDGHYWDEELKTMAKSVKNLETLIFEDDLEEEEEEYNLSDFIKDAGSNLKHVSFAHSWKTFQDMVTFFADHCPKLEKLDIGSLTKEFMRDQNNDLYPLRIAFEKLNQLDIIFSSAENDFDFDDATKNPEIEFQARESLAKSLVVDFGILPTHIKPEGITQEIKTSRMFDNRTIRVQCQEYWFDFVVTNSSWKETEFYFTRPKISQ